MSMRQTTVDVILLTEYQLMQHQNVSKARVLHE